MLSVIELKFEDITIGLIRSNTISNAENDLRLLIEYVSVFEEIYKTAKT